MNIESRKQYMDTLREKYFKENKKGKILDQYYINTKQERKYAIKKLVEYYFLMISCLHK